MGERTNSICSVYADLIENEVMRAEPDRDKIVELLNYIRKYCGQVAYPKGETPEHLKKHLIEKGSTEKGVTVYKGKKIPKSAKKLINK